MARRKPIKPITRERIIEDLAIRSLSQAEISKKYKVSTSNKKIIKIKIIKFHIDYCNEVIYNKLLSVLISNCW